MATKKLKIFENIKNQEKSLYENLDISLNQSLDKALIKPWKSLVKTFTNPSNSLSWISLNLFYSSIFHKYLTLTLFSMGGGHYDPHYHESVCCFHRARARITKVHDFVCFKICQVPVKSFFGFFFQNFEKLDIEIFWGSSSIDAKIKKFKKKIFFF